MNQSQRERQVVDSTAACSIYNANLAPNHCHLVYKGSENNEKFHIIISLEPKVTSFKMRLECFWGFFVLEKQLLTK